MPTRDEAWPDGTPCWVDSQVDDQAKAKEFYGALFGWDVQEGGADTMGYMMCLKDGRPAAGIGPKPEGFTDMPSVWSTYIASSDVDATAKDITAAGGTVLAEPFDVLEFGRMGVFADPTGAVFGLWQANRHFGAAVFNEPNALSWNELHTRDVGAAKAFYTSVFGWTYDDLSNDEMTYAVIKRAGDDEGVGGMYLDTQMPAEVPANWLTWFSVADCDDSTTKATDLDSTVLMPPMDSPFGRMSVVQGPQGEVFGMIDLETTVGEQPTANTAT